MRAQRADIKIDALWPLALFGHAVRATARGEQMRTVLGYVIVWGVARAALREFTLTLREGDQISTESEIRRRGF